MPAGTRVAQLQSVSGILSTGLIVSFTLPGLFPVLTGKTVSMLRTRRVPHHYRKPGQLDCDIAVIGAGSGGLVSACKGHQAAPPCARASVATSNR